MDLCNDDHVIVAHKIKEQPEAILGLGWRLGVYKPEKSHYFDSALWSKVLRDELWPYFLGTKDITFKHKMTVTRSESDSDVTICILDTNDLNLYLDQTSFLEEFRNFTLITTKLTNISFNLRVGNIILPTWHKRAGNVVKPIILDRKIDQIVTFNSSIQNFKDDIEADFEYLKVAIKYALSRGELASIPGKAGCLCVDIKSNGTQLQWRIQRSYLSKIFGFYFASQCSALVFNGE
jgi:hypothetical protein